MVVGIAPPRTAKIEGQPPPHLPAMEPLMLPLTLEMEEYQRELVVEEAKSWVGTPYLQQGDIKGPSGCIDCSMILVRCWVDTGVVKPFDPRPYSPSWHLHRDEELYLEWLQTVGVEVEHPRAGDVVCWRFGRCFSHGGIMVSKNRVVQASMAHKTTYIASLDEPWLKFMKDGKTLRPRKFFDIWARLREHNPIPLRRSRGSENL